MPLIVLLGIILLIVWAVLWFWIKVVSGLIHLVAVLALVMIVWGMMQKGARALQKEKR